MDKHEKIADLIADVRVQGDDNYVQALLNMCCVYHAKKSGATLSDIIENISDLFVAEHDLNPKYCLNLDDVIDVFSFYINEKLDEAESHAIQSLKQGELFDVD